MTFRICSKASALFFCIILFVSAISLLLPSTPAASAAQVMDARTAASYGKLPLSFVENRGQMDKRARFVIRGPKASAFFRNDGVTFDLWEASAKDRLVKRGVMPVESSKSEIQKHAVLKLTFNGADPKCRVKGMDRLPGKVNYITGSDKSKWHTNIPTYKGVAYRNVWTGIDILYHGDRRQLKYDIRVNPDADIRKVRLQYDGAQKMWLDKRGDLHIKTAVTEFIEKVPGIYQEKAGKKVNVTGGYILSGKNVVGFFVKSIDRSLPLVIDPASDLKYCTYLGGSSSDGEGGPWSESIAVDSYGCAYIGGHTDSPNYPTTPGAYDVINEGAAVTPRPQDEVYISKLNPQGTSLEYSTFIGNGGAGVIKGIVDMAVDENGYVYAAGCATPIGFPSTPGALGTPSYAWSVFVLKLNPSGDDLVYSATFGGASVISPSGLDIDAEGCAYVIGTADSDDFPTTPGAYDTTLDGYPGWFISKLNPSGSALVYSTFLGSYNDSAINSAKIKVDDAGCAYVVGWTSLDNFPTTPGAFDRSYNGKGDYFVTKLNSTGTGLEYSTYLGGSDNEGDYCDITVDHEGCAYISGYTRSSDFPVTPGSYDVAFNALGAEDVFVTKLNPAGSGLVFSSFLHERCAVSGGGMIALDPDGYIYVAGRNGGGDFPATPDAFWTIPYEWIGGKNVFYPVFIAKFSPSFKKLIYSTYFGGADYVTFRDLAIDNDGLVYVAGDVYSIGLQSTLGSYDRTYNGGDGDAFAAKFDITHAGLKPDMQIRLDTESSDTGTGVYSTDGSGQTKSQKAMPNQTVTYVFRVANAGSVSDSFTITGSGGGSGWTVRYFDISTNADVTSQVTSSGWTSGELASGASNGIYANVTPDSTVPVGAKNTLLIVATSDNIAKVDAVKAVTTLWLGYRPDLLIKSGTESSYSGTDVFSSDGNNQTKSQNAAPGQKITYTFKVRNAGDADDSFKVTGPSGGSGWSVKYYDLLTSAEITSQVTGAGWPSGILAPGMSKGIFVKITPDASVPVGSTNTLLITAASEADNLKIDVVKTVTTFTGSYKADMIIKAGSETKYTGTGIFNTDGTNQTKSLNVCAGQKAAYTFRAQNAGNANDSFRITGTAGGSGWSVKYYDIATNAEVTSQVTGAGWVSGTLAPRASTGVYANVRPDASVPLGSTITLTVTGTSESDNTKIDVVKAVTTCVAAYKPDMLIKNGADAVYIGEGIFNTDGTGQTKSQSASAGLKVTYSFRIKNAGYLTDSFTITGTAGGGGWSVRYYDLSSVEITSQVTGSGWPSGTLASGVDRGFFVKVSPDGTVGSGALKTLLITATSVGNSTKVDVVKAVTTVP